MQDTTEIKTGIWGLSEHWNVLPRAGGATFVEHLMLTAATREAH